MSLSLGAECSKACQLTICGLLGGGGGGGGGLSIKLYVEHSESVWVGIQRDGNDLRPTT